jgi:hypothetical protein
MESKYAKDRLVGVLLLSTRAAMVEVWQESQSEAVSEMPAPEGSAAE